MGISSRLYVLRENGQLQRVSSRVGMGLHIGIDAIPEFAGTRQKAIEALIESEDGKPVAILSATGVYWEFDAEGRLDLAESRRWIFDRIARRFGSGKPKADGNLVDIKDRLHKKQLEAKHRWKVTGEILDRIAADLWPSEAAALEKITTVKGKAPVRPPFTADAADALSKLQTALSMFDLEMTRLSEPALRGLAFRMRELAATESPGPEVWGRLADEADRIRTIKARHRTGKGYWYAVVSIWHRDSETEMHQVDQKLERCIGRPAAVEAARRLLAEEAKRFDADISVEAEVLTDLEVEDRGWLEN